MSFAFKIDKALKANLYKICRLCGIDREEKITILDGADPNDNQPVDCDGELKLHQKIIQCIGITVGKDDRMPQSACSLCVEKINDFYEFREMCYATDVQTRKLLGLKREVQKKNTTNVKPIVDVKPIIDIKEVKEEVGPKRGRKRKADDTIPKVLPKVGLPKVVGAKVVLPKVVVPKVVVPKVVVPKVVPKVVVPKVVVPKVVPKVGLAKVVVPKEDPTTEVKTEVLSQPSSNKKPRLSEPAPVETKETKKKGKLGKQVDKAVKPKEEIKDEPVEVKKPTTASTEKPTKFKQVCSICNQRFGNKIKLEQHVASTHVPHIPRYVCTACNEIIKKTNDIKSHQLWHKLTKTPYMCGHCGQSLISSYAYSRHLRDHTVDIPANLWVLDRECPQCHQTFLTNFLYNTHTCAVKTKKCAGCNRQLRSEVEYQRHAAHCNKVYLNYSKHIPVAAAAAESTIRIKNENDVEAAAAEALARSSGISLDMAPVVSLTRISSPEIMAARQGITDFVNDNAAVQADEPKTPGKKGSKKGVSRKDLKRVDNLLKSTLDALVSIKHEPEVQVETDAETAPAPAPVPPTTTEPTAPAAPTEPSTAENATNKEEEESPAVDGDTFTHTDDFHHGDDDDDSNDVANTDANTVADTTVGANTKDLAIKQEPVEETLAQSDVNIKQEIIDLDNDNSVPAAKMPVLKLKIKKEHGMLNSSIVDEQSARAEKKKKKRERKRKDAARNKDKSSDGDEQPQESTAVQDEDMERAEDTLPQPNIVVAIKQEKPDEIDNAAESHRAGSSEPLQLEPTVMTTIPIPQFQISAISSGVEFDVNIAAADAIEEQADIETGDDAETTEMTPDETEMEDIKPNKAELDRLFKITSISSGVQMDNETEMENDKNLENSEEIADRDPEDATSIMPPPPLPAPQNELEESVSNVVVGAQKNITKSTPKVVKQKAAEQKTRPAPPVRAAKAFKSTSGVSKTITTNSSSSETTPIPFSQIQIKPEPVDRGYEDVFKAYEAAANPSSSQSSPTNEELSINEIAEQEYLKNIDFANIQIKQEKDLDVSDVEITNTHIVANAIPNGMTRSNGEESQYSENEEDMNSVDNEETDLDDDDDEDEDDDDDDWDGVKIAEDEKREYRELEMPPLLTTEEPDATENQNAHDEVIQEKEHMAVAEQMVCQVDNEAAEKPSTSNPVEPFSAEDHELTANNVNQTTNITEENSSGTTLMNEHTDLPGTDATGDIEKPNESVSVSLSSEPAPLPFIISSIYSQADNDMTHQLPEVMDTDVNMADAQYSDTVSEPAHAPMELPTLKISSVLAGCSATFDDLPNQLQPHPISTDYLPTTLSADEAMEIGDENVNIGINESTNLLQDAVETLKNIIDAPMDTTPATETMCMEINEDKDALVEAQPFTAHDTCAVSTTSTATATATTTADASQSTAPNSNENVAIGLSIQNVVGNTPQITPPLNQNASIGLSIHNVVGDATQIIPPANENAPIGLSIQNVVGDATQMTLPSNENAPIGLSIQNVVSDASQMALFSNENAPVGLPIENALAEAFSTIPQSNENIVVGLSIQNVVGGAIHTMNEDIVEEAQNLLNHEVVEQQANHQQLAYCQSTSQFIEHTQNMMTQNVEETENLMNESVAEALLLQQQPHHYTDIQICSISSADGDGSGILMPTKYPDSDKNCSSISNNESAHCSNVGITTSQSTVLNNPFLLDDSNINEIAENNNNANIERELQDDVIAGAAAPTLLPPSAITPSGPTSSAVESNNENITEEQNNVDLMDTKTIDIT